MAKQATTQATEPTAAPFDPLDVSRQLTDIVQNLDLSDPLPRAERENVRSRSEAVPDTIVEQVATIAEINGGSVAGIPFDAASARQTLAHVRAARGVSLAARQLAAQIDDDCAQRRAVVADRAFAIYRALGRMVNTPEGKSLRRLHEDMRTAVRAHRRVRRVNGELSAETTPPVVPPEAPSPAANGT